MPRSLRGTIMSLGGDYRVLYASASGPGMWLGVAGLAVGALIFLVAVPLDAIWIIALLASASAIGIAAFISGRRTVTHLARREDTLIVALTGNRSFAAPVSDFVGWRYVELGRASAINVHRHGQRYVLPASTATTIDAEGFGELDAGLGRALAGRWNAGALRPRR
jgi:hypothetical protein